MSTSEPSGPQTVTSEVEAVAVHGDVALRLSVKGAEEGAAASFEIKKVEDDSVVTTIQGEIKDSTAVGQWTPDLTPDGDVRSLRVYYTVTVDDQTIRSQELEVYLDYVEITSIDEQGAALPDVPYVVTVAGEKREGTTGSTGINRETGLPPGDVTFDWGGAYQLVEWVDESGATRKAKLKNVQRMKFDWPSPAGNGGLRAWQEDGTEVELEERFHAWTQYMNQTLDANTADGRARGPKLTCRVRSSDPSTARKGEKVFVKAVWPAADELSKRDDPDAPRQLVDGGDKDWAQGDTEKGLELEFAEDGGEVTFEVLLGKAGGDQVTLHIGGNDRCEDAKLVVTNRRKVGYETTRMEHQAAPDITKTREWFAPAAVEVEAQGKDVVWKDQPDPNGDAFFCGLARVPAAWFEEGAEGERVVVGNHNLGWFMSKFADPGSRRTTVQLVVADAVAFGVQNGTPRANEQIFMLKWIPEKAENGTTRLSTFIPLPSPGNFEVFERSLGDGLPCVRGAKWKIPTGRAVPRALRQTQGDIDPAWITVERHRVETRTVDEQEVTYDGRYGVWLTLPPESDPALALVEGVEVRFAGSLAVAEVGYSGISNGHMIVVLGGGLPETDSVILAHELGHSMRLVPSLDPRRTELESRFYHLPPGLDFPDHATAFQGKGMFGGHCWFGLDDAGASHLVTWDPDGNQTHEAISGAAHEQEDYTLLRKQDGDTYTEVGGTCIMYGSVAAADTRTGLCEDCTKFLEAGALEDLHKGTVAAITSEARGGPETVPEPPAKLRVQLLDALHRPCANASYDLTMPSGTAVSGTTDAGGWLEQELTDRDRRDAAVVLSYTPEGADEAIELTLHLTATMDVDCDSDAVFLAHLRNLGYGDASTPAAEMVARFQAAVGLPTTGTLDEPTKDAIDDLLRTDDSLEPQLHREEWEE